jgi:hypothetical protein
MVAVDEYVQGGAINREINCFFLLQCKDLHLLLKLMVALESTGWYTFCWGIAYIFHLNFIFLSYGLPVVVK